MRELIKKRPAFSFLVFIVVWTWIFMAAIIALVPIDPVEGPQFAHVALVFFVASPSVFGFLFARTVDGKRGVQELLARTGRWRANPIWYAASLLLIPAIAGFSYLIQGLLGGPTAPIDSLEKLALAVPISLLTGGLLTWLLLSFLGR